MTREPKIPCPRLALTLWRTARGTWGTLKWPHSFPYWQRKFGSVMRNVLLFMAVLGALPAYAAAPVVTDKPVAQIDGLIATAKGGSILVQARGAVMGGGWKHAVLKPIKPVLAGDTHTIVLAFVAQPPPSNQAVVPGLLPVTATLRVKARKGVVSVRVTSAVNEITTQILK